MKKKLLLLITTLCLSFCLSCGKKETVDSLTYAVFPYLPDPEYYQELIEQRWQETEPDIRLVRKNWDAYFDGKPEGIDVVMYDAVLLNKMIDSGWIQPIERKDIQTPEDIFPTVLDGITINGKLYGIPVFLCGNFLIYDKRNRKLEEAEHFTDLSGEKEILVINTQDSFNRPEYAVETLADDLGAANPALSGDPYETVLPIDPLAVKDHIHDTDQEVASAYEAGIGEGYIGFSESLRYLKNRLEYTDIKSISFSEHKNVLRIYADPVSVTAGVDGLRREKALKLMNIIADPGILSALSVQEGKPWYLLISRKSLYAGLKEKYPIYAKLEELASNPENHVIIAARDEQKTD